MARKRGGLAGIWDRNKKIIKPIATTLAGALGTPALGAAVGTAMGGLDRPGQSGVGLDVGGALKGGVSGYGLGKVGSAAAGAFKAAPTLGAIGSGATNVANAGAAGGGQSLLGGLGAAAKSLIPSALSGGGLPGLGALGSGGVGSNLALGGLAAAQLANAAALGKKSGDFADKSWDLSNDWWNQRAPLRAQGVAGMQAPPVSLPQLGKIGAAGNPFAGG